MRRVNPVTRVVAAILLTLPVVITLDWVSASVVLGATLLSALMLRVRPGILWRRLLPLLMISPIAAISMALYGKPGGRIHLDWGLIVISDMSLTLALAVFIRVFALGLPSLLLLTTIDPTDMADGLSQVLRLPARFVLGSLAGVRMMGLLLEDWRTLSHARRARGLGDDRRLRRWSTMAFTLMVFAVRRGSRLATAMEARGFGGDERTWARPSRVGWPDALAVLIAILIGLLAVGAAWWAGTLWIVGS